MLESGFRRRQEFVACVKSCVRPAMRIAASAPPAHLDREHPAELPHLPPRQRMGGVAGQPRIMDDLDGGVLGQEFGDALGVDAVGAHPVGQRANAAQQPAVKGRGRGTRICCARRTR